MSELNIKADCERPPATQTPILKWVKKEMGPGVWRVSVERVDGAPYRGRIKPFICDLNHGPDCVCQSLS